MAQMRKTDGGSSAEPLPPSRVLVSDDRVNFTVQSEIPVSTSADGSTNAAEASHSAGLLAMFARCVAALTPHVNVCVFSCLTPRDRQAQQSEASAEASAGPEAQWLRQFTDYLKYNATQLNGGFRRRGPDTLPAVQALYHSSALPNALPLPSMRRQKVGIVPNGLIGACLTSFTEVHRVCLAFFAPCCITVMPLSQHKRLVLRPDDIFLPLLDAAATHVFQNGEASRNVFVGHAGKKV